MKIKIFKIHIDEQLQDNDIAVVNQFLTQFKILNINSNLIKEDVAFWSLLIQYEENEKTEKPGKISIKSEDQLSEEELIIYDRLKDWRLQKSKELDQPPYIIFHNTHLMSIARYKPKLVDELNDIAGIGTTKIMRFGPELIELLNDV